jgi:monoamine oxidase
MKFVIVGGGITALYIGYMLKQINIDFVIYEKESIVGGKMMDKKGKYKIYPHFKNMISLLKGFNIPIILSPNKPKIIYDYLLFEKIRLLYNKLPLNDITIEEFIKNNLSPTEYILFISYIQKYKLNQMNVNDYMLYNHNNLLLSNQSEHRIYIDKKIIKKLASSIKNNIFVNHNVQEITYMPLTNKYLLKVNDIFINADKLILTTNMNIKLKIPEIIATQFNHIISYKEKTTKWENAYHINTKKIKTDFYKKYNLILAIHPWLNNLEGSCLCAIYTINIINKEIYNMRSEYLYNIY